MISVVMLTYNRENLISCAIDSVIAQSCRDFEFIIVDNGSTDKSGHIAEKYAAKDARIRVIHRPRGSIGAGRNTGLDAAKGDYIAFIDDDDYLEADFLEFLYNLATENNADVSICGAADKIFDELLILTPEQALIELMWRKRYNMAFPTKMFTRALAAKIRFPEDDKYDDITQMHKLLACANQVAYHGLPKYTFYRHTGNNSAWTTTHELLDRQTLKEYLAAYRERTIWLSEIFPKSAAAWRYFEWSFMISMVEKVARLRLDECFDLRDTLILELERNKDEFENSEYIQGFEREWMGRYVGWN